MIVNRFVSAALLVLAIMVGASADAQQATRVYRVGALFNRAPDQEDRDVEILKEGLARLGYVGANLIVRFARFYELACSLTLALGHHTIWTRRCPTLHQLT